MSRSQTYRPTYLTEEQRRELTRQAHHARFRSDLLPTLRDHVCRCADGLAGQGRLPESLRVSLERRLSTVTTLESLRSLATELAPSSVLPTAATSNTHVATTGIPAQGGGITPTVLSATAAALGQEVDMAGCQFDLFYLRSELSSLRRTADELDLQLADEPRAIVAVDVVAAALEGGDGAAALAALNEARVQVERLGDLVDEAIAAAECTNRTTEAVLGTLAAMGFAVREVVTAEEGTVVVATGPDGRQACVEVIGTEGEAGCNAEFTDPGDAVSLDHPDAGDTCLPAVADSADFHRLLAGRRDLVVGPIEASDRPTRGSARISRPGVSPAGRRTTPRHRSNP